MLMHPAALAQKAVAPSLPPPVGGWDTRNALADMPVQNAVILDNFFPDTDRVRLRAGSTEYADGMSGNVDSLMPYAALDGSEKLFAANGGNFYDVTDGGEVGAPDATGFSGDQWQHTQMNTTGGNFLFAVNGLDTPQVYDGTTFSGTTVTGPTVANLAWCNVHQRRLWFGEKGSLTAHYLAADAITGAASNFHFGGIAKRGGFLQAMGTWTRDSGSGEDDAAVFLTSEGEAIVYRGTDPSDDTLWSLVGVFNIGVPIGRRCFTKFGGDLVLLTQDGIVPASKMFITDRVQAELVAISQQINQAFNDAVRSNASLFGWEPIVYPKGRMLLVNVPDTTTTFNQFVFNTITQAPCRFTGNNARCFALLDDSLYFGTTDGRVIKADDGSSDDGNNITGDVLQAFTYFGDPGRNKVFRRVEPIFQSNGDPGAALDLQLDFKVTNPISAATVTPTTSALWGVGKWGVGTWGTASQVFRGWRGVRGVGRSAALRVRVDTTTVRPSWVATSFMYIPAGII